MTAVAERFDDIDLAALDRAGMSLNDAAEWPDRFEIADDLIAMRDAGISPDDAARWPDRFIVGGEIAVMHAAGITPDEAARWPGWLSGYEITDLIGANINVDYAHEASAGTPARNIIQLARYGLHHPDRAGSHRRWNVS